MGAVTVGLITAEKSTISGKVTKNYEVKIINADTNEILGPNQEGELCARGPAQLIGYWKNPEATAEAIDSEGILSVKHESSGKNLSSSAMKTR